VLEAVTETGPGTEIAAPLLQTSEGLPLIGAALADAVLRSVPTSGTEYATETAVLQIFFQIHVTQTPALRWCRRRCCVLFPASALKTRIRNFADLFFPDMQTPEGLVPIGAAPVADALLCSPAKLKRTG